MEKGLMLSDFYPARFLAAEDLQGRKVTVLVADVFLETLDMVKNEKDKPMFVVKETKPIVSLADPKTKEIKKKQFMLGKTNTQTLILLFGKRAEDLVGKRIDLIADEDYDTNGAPVAAVRVISSPDATPERSAAMATAWKGKRKRGALIKRLKKAVGLIESKNAFASEFDGENPTSVAKPPEQVSEQKQADSPPSEPSVSPPTDPSATNTP